MEKADVTKKLLIAVAEDFNTVMGLDPPIKSGRTITKEMLIKDLVEAAKELQKDDTLKKETIEILTALEIKLPEEVQPEPDVETEGEPEKKTEGKPDKELEKESKEKEAEIPTKKPTTKAIKPDAKKPDVKPATKKPDVKPAAKDVNPDAKAKRYTRAQAFCDALQGKPKTIEEIGQKMLELYQKHGSATKHTQLKSVVWAAMIYIHPMTLLGFVKKEDQKYSLK